MARNWLFGSRSTEATTQELIATGAAGGAWGVDPIDGDRGYTPLGMSAREQPTMTTEKLRAYSIAAYRSNPMGRAIIDTFTSFACGDSGVNYECDDPEVRAVVDEWWNDPRNRVGMLQTLLCRDWMMMGEHIWEYLVSDGGVVLFSPISPSRVSGVELLRGNPLWHDKLIFSGMEQTMQIVTVDPITGLREGQVAYVPSWRTLITDRRGVPFLAPAIDDLDAYAHVLSNLVDRTALARYASLDVTVDGDKGDIDAYIKNRGGTHMPPAGSIEVHNKKIEIKPLNVMSGSFEDTNTAQSVLTNIAAAAGLSKPWLAETEGANRATAMSMAEPVRRRVAGLQIEWLQIMTGHLQYVVDQAVRAGRLPMRMPMTDLGGETVMVPPAQLVRATGPKIAAADAQITSTVILNLGTGIENLVKAGALTPSAAGILVAKAWEQFVGRPMPASMAVDPSKISPDAAAEEIDAATTIAGQQTEGLLYQFSRPG